MADDRARVTRREGEVLAALADRLTNAEIAARLYISERTVESHVSSLLRKLRASDRLQLSAMARQMGTPAAPVLPAPLELLADASTYVGRGAELSRLRALWERSCHGHTQVVVIEGDAGIGKSRLVAEFVAALDTTRGQVVFGACFEDVTVPYQGLADAIAADVASRSPSEVRAQVVDPAALVRAVPEIAHRLGPMTAAVGPDGVGEREDVAAALVSYLQTRAVHKPVALVVEDVHWAPTSTRAALMTLARAAGSAPILALVTTRHTAPDLDRPTARFLIELLSLPATHEIELHGLDDGEVAQLLAMVGATGDAAAMRERTGGNPLFIREAASGDESTENTAAHRSVTRLLQQRYAHLDDDDLGVLDVAVVLGTEFDAEVLAAVVGRPLLDTLETLERVEGAGLIAAQPSRPGSFVFAHALFRSVRYDAMPYRRRLEIHQQVAEALDRDPQDTLLPVLARHACAAAPIGDAAPAFELARLAGERAEHSLALDEAAEQFRLAIEVAARRTDPDAETDVLRMRVRYGEMLNRIGDPAHRTVLLDAADAARRVGDAEALADIAWALTQYGSSQSPGSSDRQLVEVAEDALAGLGPQQTATRALALAALAADLAVGEDPVRAFDLVSEALAIARQLNDPMTLGWVLAAYRWAARVPGNAQARYPTADELIAVGRRTGMTMFTVLGMATRAMSYREEGRFAACDETVAQYEAIVDDRPIPPNVRSQLIMFHAMRQFLAGDLHGADRTASSVFDLPVTGSFDPRRFYGLALLYLRHAQGRLRELIGGIERSGVQALPGMRALAYAHAGRTADAGSLLRTIARSGYIQQPTNPTWTVNAILLAEAALMTGEEDVGAELFRALLPYTGTLSSGLVVEGPVDLALAQAALVTGDHQQAEEFAGRVVDTARTWGTPLYLGRALVIQANLQRGDAAAADVLLAEALEIADRFDMLLIRQEADRLCG